MNSRWDDSHGRDGSNPAPEGRTKKPYVAPVLIAYGPIEKATHGVGSFATDNIKGSAP